MPNVISSLFIAITAFGWGTQIDDSFYSTALGGNNMVDVFLPEGYDANDTTTHYPVVYYLHARGGTQNSGTNNIIAAWMDASQSGQINPIILVKPNGWVTPFYGSFYVNSDYYGAFEDYIVDDLVAYIDSAYNTIPEQQFRVLTGHSMGGYGSMMLGLKHPDRYRALSAHSGTPYSFNWIPDWIQNEVLPENGGSGPFDPDLGWRTDMMFNFGALFSPNSNNPPYNLDLPFDNQGNMIDSIFALWQEHTATRWASKYDPEVGLAIQFTIGSADGDIEPSIYKGNMAFSDSLDSLGIPYKMHIYDVSHYGLLYERNLAGLGFLDSVMWETVGVEQVELKAPMSFMLHQNYPNPFNPNTTISYSITEQSKVRLSVFDIRGQEVMTPQDGSKSPGNYEVQWNGMDQSGNPVSTGVYFCRLEAGSYSQSIKMVYLR